MSENEKQKKANVYSIITSRITKQLEEGVIPWQKSCAESGLPQSVVTKRPYRGINVWLLAMLSFPRNNFITTKQLKEVGGVVKEEEKAALVTFWNWKEVTDEQSGESKNIPFLRYYTVYNSDQCDGIPDEVLPAPPVHVKNPVKQAEQTVLLMQQKPVIKHREKKSFYDPCLDIINVPKIDTFESQEYYYRSLFHQLIHATGHVSRLNRKEVMLMSELRADESFSSEELIAEMGTGYLMSVCGFTNDFVSKDKEVRAKGWLEKFKENKQLVIYAGGKAQQAVDFILNVSFKEKTVEPSTETVADKDEVPF